VITATPQTPAPAIRRKAASRTGKVQLGGYIDPDAKRQMDVFAAMNGRTVQSIVEEMVDDWFRKHGLHRLAGEGPS
jgi:hypothetical protein